jgi:asparagine synthase (glutamine-hydrolysing)
MCGIFGYFNIPEGNEKLLRKMAEQQMHRGPDSEGFYINGAFGFGIRRLSVIDLVTGDQPIHNEDETVWVVCNGEIYNYQELSKSLKEKGHIFYTKSDVECLVHLYEEDSIDFLQQLNGMFAFALYDAKKKCLYVARDRLGIKPLYYSAAAGNFLFASELRSLLATDYVSRDLDWDALSMFLDLMYIPTPYSPCKSISKLQPGHYFKINSNLQLEEHAYWNLEQHPPVCFPKSESEAIERLTYFMRDSGRLQLRADVPLCAFLSGGIDSSAVVAFAAMESSFPLRTYHVYFESAQGKMDERPYARAVASRYGTVHSEVTVGRSDFNRLIPQLLWHLEEPFGDLASIPTFIISEMARKEVTVCLNGSGGDELFAGYAYHSYPAYLKKVFLSGMDKVGIGGNVRSLLGKANNPKTWKATFPHYQKRSAQTLLDDKGRYFEKDLINSILAQDIDGYLQSNVLFLLDKIAMAVSLEGRVPLLDHRLVEYAAHLPSQWKIRNGERKYIFKKALEPYLPHEVLYRKKEGFGAPLSDWLEADMRTDLQRIVTHGVLRKNGLLSIDADMLACLNPWDLWKIVCLELWYRLIAHPMGCPLGMSLKDFI